MAILNTVRTAFNQGWEALGDLRQTVTVRRVSRGGYNPTTGATADTIVSASVPAILTSYESELVDGTDIRVGDLRCIINGKDTDFRPQQGDTVDLPDGERWTVTRATGDTYSPRIYHDLTLRR
jgi:hypothetical protein